MKNHTLILNGQACAFSTGDTLSGLFIDRHIDETTVVVEHNGNIIAMKELNNVFLQPGDTVEIIHFVGGG